jgi:hypothetical protein
MKDQTKKLSLFEKLLIVIVGLMVLWMFVVMLTPLPVQAADFHGEMEIGYDIDNQLWEYSVEVDLGQQVWKLYPHVFGGWYTLTEVQSLDTWTPWVQVYRFGAGVRINRIDLTYTHYCMHPIWRADGVLFGYSDYILQGGNKIAVRYSW